MWALVILSSLAVLVILVLCVPLDIALHVDVYGRPEFRMRLIWLFGLVSKEAGGNGRKKPEEKEKRIEDKREHKERRIRARTIFEILRIKGLPGHLKGLVADILSHLDIRELQVNFKVGLDTPADTALLFGPIGIATLFLDSSWRHEIAVQPSFDGEAIFEGYLHTAVRLRPIQLVAPFIRFAFSLATIRGIKILVLTKWRRKK